MTETESLGDRMKEHLPAEIVGFVKAVGAIGGYQGSRLYLVGGVVRDLLLGRANLDLDLVVEGDALALARQASAIFPGKLTLHPRFGTARLRQGDWSIDFARSRSETYEHPGALPSVRPGTLADDLFRRDFTINAMAIRLGPGRYGELVDIYGGHDDLDGRLIRILHEQSFVDDATRIWRALRYEQRLRFRLEAKTRKLLARDVPMLDTISGDRIRHELELVLEEAEPEKALLRAHRFGVLSRLHPSLRVDAALAAAFKQARNMATGTQLVHSYFALLAYRLTGEEVEELVSRLRLPARVARVVYDSQRLKAVLGPLAAGLPPSQVYACLRDCSPAALVATAAATGSSAARRAIRAFLGRLRYVRPALTGDDLLRMGVTAGPRVREILERLRAERLDGRVASRRQEEELVKEYLGTSG